MNGEIYYRIFAESKTVNDLRLFSLPRKCLATRRYWLAAMGAVGQVFRPVYSWSDKNRQRVFRRGGLGPAPSGRHEQRPNQRRTNQTTTSTNFTKRTTQIPSSPASSRKRKKTKKQTKTKITAHVNECCACTLPHFYTSE